MDLKYTERVSRMTAEIINKQKGWEVSMVHFNDPTSLTRGKRLVKCWYPTLDLGVGAE